MNSKTVLMFSGQGSHYYQMGKTLFAEHAIFRQWMITLDDLAEKRVGRRVIGQIYASDKTEVFDQILFTHPAIFMIEYSLAQCLLHEGVKPDLVLGTSLGSFCAAAVAGYITVEDALIAVIKQAEAFTAACEYGGMISILAAPLLYEENFLHEHCELAGVNFDSHFAVSAPQAALWVIEQALEQRGIIHQRLAVSFAFHSQWIEKAQQSFISFMSSIELKPTGLPLVCCEQREVLTQLPDDFFWRVVRYPIRFWETIKYLEQSGPYRYVDVGPSGTLATFVKYGLPSSSRSTAYPVLTPFDRAQGNLAALLATQ